MTALRTIRGIIADAISDRESYLDAWSSVPDHGLDIEGVIARLKSLAARYQGDKRVRLSPEERRTLVSACDYALIWRRGYSDAISNTRDTEQKRIAQRDIRKAERLLDTLQPNRPDPMAGAKLVSLDEIKAKNLGTLINAVRENGVETRTITENGVLLGTVIVEADGVVRARLADGSTVNEPFEEAFDAQEWILARYSNNLIFRDPEVARPRP